MKRFWDRIFGLDLERTIWVEEEDLGTDKKIFQNHKRYFVKIPAKIDKRITLRLRGLGKKRGGKAGNLLLHVWLNQGEDVNRSLWLSDTSASNGADKRLLLDEKTITIVIPPKSHHGLTIRLKGYGNESSYTRDAPVPHRKRGNLFVSLFVYPDSIQPLYGSFESLSTDNMAWEGWIYLKIDEAIRRIGVSSFRIKPVQADEIADLFNENGWRSIFDTLVSHLKLTHLHIELKRSNSISQPGSCERTVVFKNNVPVGNEYLITINEQFLDNPFSIAAILAHELCHIIFSEKFGESPQSAGYTIKSEQATLDEEHTVDLLVFMFKIGEFQLRIARDKRLTFGYFNQEMFERMQVIVSKKLN